MSSAADRDSDQLRSLAVRKRVSADLPALVFCGPMFRGRFPKKVMPLATEDLSNVSSSKVQIHI